MQRLGAATLLASGTAGAEPRSDVQCGSAFSLPLAELTVIVDAVRASMGTSSSDRQFQLRAFLKSKRALILGSIHLG